MGTRGRLALAIHDQLERFSVNDEFSYRIEAPMKASKVLGQGGDDFEVVEVDGVSVCKSGGGFVNFSKDGLICSVPAATWHVAWQRLRNAFAYEQFEFADIVTGVRLRVEAAMADNVLTVAVALEAYELSAGRDQGWRDLERLTNS
jgi:hypothetical protein